MIPITIDAKKNDHIKCHSHVDVATVQVRPYNLRNLKSYLDIWGRSKPDMPKIDSYRVSDAAEFNSLSDYSKTRW